MSQERSPKARVGIAKQKQPAEFPFGLAPLGMAVAAAFGSLPFDSQANPQGGQVVAGQARIQQTAPNRVDIIQSSNRAAINWQSFSIAPTEHVNFQQPSTTSATLNRVVGADPSQIMGRLTANGQIFLINPNGVLFGHGAKVDVGSLVTSTTSISNENFMAGRLTFDQVTNRNATIINRGEITAAQGGLVALVAPGVENSGVIRAEMGKVALASGNAFTLDLYGDRLVRLSVDEQALGHLTDVEGRTLQSLVSNSGTIRADGGSVLLTTSTAKAIVDSAVNMSGVIQANSFEHRPGEIVLHAQSGATTVSGTLSATGSNPGESGGIVQVLGQNAHLTGTAKVNVSGHSGGGAALIGGDWQGGGTAPRATSTTIDAGADINADAIARGDGGKVVVWADRATRFDGQVSARGGAQGGNGGQVEVSGKQTLAYNGSVDASAPNGTAGSLLLDPTDWIINETDADNFSRTLRQGTNVTIQADNNIEVNQSIDGRTGRVGGALSLDAGNRITLNNDLVTNNGTITLKAGAGGIVMGTTSHASANNGAVVYAGNHGITLTSGGSVDAQHLITTGAVSITTTGAAANVTLNRELNGIGENPLGSLSVKAAGSIKTAGLNATGTAVLDAGGTIEFMQQNTSGAFAAGSINATAAGAIDIKRDLVGRGAGAVTITSTGSTMTMGNATTARTATIGSQNGGSIALKSSDKLTVGDILTTGAASLESTGNTVELKSDLLGPQGSNGVGQLTIRSGTALTIDRSIKSTAGIDIQAGGTTAEATRNLTLFSSNSTSRLDARGTVHLNGANITLPGGEIHTNGAGLQIDARNGGFMMGLNKIGSNEISPISSLKGGLFTGAGDITINSTSHIQLTNVSLTGNLSATSKNGAIFLDGDVVGITSRDAAGNPSTHPVNSIYLDAGGSYLQARTYFTDYDFSKAPNDQPAGIMSVVTSPVGIRMREINAGTVTAKARAEVLLDGTITARGDVKLEAPIIRGRHSIFATGGDIKIGGALIVEPWGDEIYHNFFGEVITSSTFQSGGFSEAKNGVPGFGYRLDLERQTASGDPTRITNLPGWNTASVDRVDDVTSQITIRAEAVDGRGGRIELTESVGREHLGGTGMRAEQQFAQLDRAAGLQFILRRENLPLTPINDIRVNLESTNGVTFRAGATGKFNFNGPIAGTNQTRFNDPLPENPRSFTGNPTTADINHPYFRLVLRRSGGLDTTEQAVTAGSGTTIPNGFSGTLTSLNDNPQSNEFSSYARGAKIPDLFAQIARIFPGEANYVQTMFNPSGYAPAPSAGNVTQPPTIFAEINPNSLISSGTQTVSSPNNGTSVSGARNISPPAEGRGSLEPIPNVEPTSSPSAIALTDTTSATSSLHEDANITGPAEGELDLTKLADLGRGFAVRGSTGDVFRAGGGIVRFSGTDPSASDVDYFSLPLFEYLARHQRGGTNR